MVDVMLTDSRSQHSHTRRRDSEAMPDTVRGCWEDMRTEGIIICKSFDRKAIAWYIAHEFWLRVTWELIWWLCWMRIWANEDFFLPVQLEKIQVIVEERRLESRIQHHEEVQAWHMSQLCFMKRGGSLYDLRKSPRPVLWRKKHLLLAMMLMSIHAT